VKTVLGVAAVDRAYLAGPSWLVYWRADGVAAWRALLAGRRRMTWWPAYCLMWPGRRESWRGDPAMANNVMAYCPVERSWRACQAAIVWWAAGGGNLILASQLLGGRG